MIHPDGESLVSEDLMGEIFVWNAKTGQRTRELKSVMTGFDNKFQADMGGARDMAFNADGSLLGCAGITNVVNSFAGQQDQLSALSIGQPRKLAVIYAQKVIRLAWPGGCGFILKDSLSGQWEIKMVRGR